MSEDWEYEEGDNIVEDETFVPSFEGAGKVGGGTVYEVKRRLVDADSDECFYFVEHRDGDRVKTSLKDAEMVHNLFELAERAGSNPDEC